MATRSSGTPIASTAVSSLNRLSRISVNAAATTGMIPESWLNIRKALKK
jgi:hypothetical protein